MRLKTVYLKNFRCYKDEISIDFDNLTTLIGKNDIGKSTILDGLEIFFNNSVVQIDQSDANIYGDEFVTITCDFCELPQELILDSGEKTNLAEEYLTLSEDLLRVKKVYDCSKVKISPKIYIVANCPNNSEVQDLWSLKEKDLQKIVKEKGLDVALKGNPSMRKAIWSSIDNLDIKETEVEVSKIKEDGKEIWTKIDAYLPAYALFQSDRNSQDSDIEIQNPMKMAIQEAISEEQEEIDLIQKKVQDKVMAIAEQTQEALRFIAPKIASQLTPTFTPATASKWNSLFSIGLNTDEGIALNKRGSGIRRMVLVAFFKAAADRKLNCSDSKKKNIIYAIEEPETAQHPINQRILVNSFKELSQSEQCQVILTTHSPGLAQELPIDSLRFIDRNDQGQPIIQSGENILPSIVKELGIFADPASKVQVILYLEGPTDVVAFKAFSRCLRERYHDVVDLENDKRIVIIPLGGSVLKHWVEQKYLKELNRPEVYICDNDVKDYQKAVATVNLRTDGSWGVLTKKYEIENYLHPVAIKQIYGVDIDTSEKDVPKLFGKEYFRKKGYLNNNKEEGLKSKTAKRMLSKVFEEAMNLQLLEEIDPDGEVKGWFDKISSMLQ